MSAPEPTAVVEQYRGLSQQYIRARLGNGGRRRTDKMLKLQGQMLDVEEALTARGLEALRKALYEEHTCAGAIARYLTGTDPLGGPESQIAWRCHQYPQRREAVAAALAGGTQ